MVYTLPRTEMNVFISHELTIHPGFFIFIFSYLFFFPPLPVPSFFSFLFIFPLRFYAVFRLLFSYLKALIGNFTRNRLARRCPPGNDRRVETMDNAKANIRAKFYNGTGRFIVAFSSVTIGEKRLESSANDDPADRHCIYGLNIETHHRQSAVNKIRRGCIDGDKQQTVTLIHERDMIFHCCFTLYH